MTNPPLDTELWREQGKKVKPVAEPRNQSGSIAPTPPVGTYHPVAPVSYPPFPPSDPLTGFPPFSYPPTVFPPYAPNPYLAYPHMPGFPPPYPQPTDNWSLPPPPDGASVTDFCQEYNLGDEVLSGLNALQFQMGDDHREISPEQLDKVKFARHHWKRFCRAYSKYKHANK